MKNLRRHLGPGYTDYPAKRAGEYLGDKVFKLIMWVICCGLWAGAYCIGLHVFNFTRSNFSEGAKEMTVSEIFMRPASLGVYGFGCFIIFLMVMKSRRGEKRIVRHRRATASERRGER